MKMLKGKNLGNLIIKLLMCILLFTGCSSNSNVENHTVEEKGESVEKVAMPDQMEDLGVSLESSLNRKIIKTGKIYIETKDFETSIKEVVEQIEERGGFIENSMIEGDRLSFPNRYRNAEIRLRLPNENFEPFINQASIFGNVRKSSVEGEDVTDVYVDTETRLKSLETQRQRLFDLLENSGSLTELLEIEKELANVSYQIESLKGSLNHYDSLIEYSTIAVRVEEVRDYTDTQKNLTLKEKIVKRFNESVEGVKRFAERFTLLIVGMIPVLLLVVLPVGLFALAIAFGIKKIKERKRR